MGERFVVEINPDLSDRMLNAAFSNEFQTPEQRIEELVSAHNETMARLRGNWHDLRPDDIGYTASAIHNAMSATCLPSLVAIVDQQPQTYDIARSTFSNLQALCATILDTGVIQAEDRIDNERVRSVSGEMAVLATIWYGIKRDWLGDISHVVPATSIQDRGEWVMADYHPLRQRPRKRSIDLMAREESQQEWPIQVKLGPGRHRRSDRKWYDLDIITLYVRDLRRLGVKTPERSLVQAIAIEDESHLEKASEHILKKIILNYSRKYQIEFEQKRRKENQ
jgi:hypothetical protein